MQSHQINFINVADAAALIGVTPQAVRDMIRRGELPGAKKLSQGINAPFVLSEAVVQSLIARRKLDNSQ